MVNISRSIKGLFYIILVTDVDDESVLFVHMFIDRTIITIDFLQDLVLSHAVRIHL